MSDLTCEASWPVEPDGKEYAHGTKRSAYYLVSWKEKRGRVLGEQTYRFACCEDHAIAAQAWGNVSVYRLELVEEPDQ
jgi:hypothetical protein